MNSLNSRNPLVFALATALVVAVGTIGYLAVQLHAARRDLIHTLPEASHATTARAATSQPNLATSAASHAATVGSGSPRADRTSATAKASAGVDVRDPIEFAGKMLDDPKTAALLQSQLADRLSSRYAPLLEKLNLTAEQKKQLLELLVEREMATLDAARMLHDRPGVSSKEKIDTLLTIRNDADQPIRALLGSQFDELTNFDRTIPFRTEADHITSAVALGEAPLNTAQRESLVQGLIQTGSVRTATYLHDGVFDREGYLSALVAHDNAVLKSVKDNLNPTQYAALSHYFESQRAKNAMASSLYGKK
jgi:hypothetical protein